VTLARPLLCLSRAETRAYCAGKGIAFVDDETNGDTSILRNRVRLELLPAMEEVLPGARDALLRTADEAADACCVLEAVAETVIVAKHSGEVVLSKARLRALPEPAWPVALRLAVERLAGDARDLDRRHYAQLGRAIAARTGAVLQLPRGLALHVDRDEIVLIEQAQVRTPILGEIALPFAGVVGDWQLHVTRAQQPSEEQLYLPEGAVIRGRRPGDRIWTRAGTRKLQDVFVDAGVPRRWRDAVPVIADGASVLWTPYGGAGGRDGQLYRIAAERRDGMACA
jgi:tRNA(Ile)-lysidine synthase